MKVVVKINKVVVGSSCGDVPKYVGEGVALCGTPGTLGVPWLWCSCSMAVFRQFWVGALDAAHLKCVILFADVTSLNGTVTSYVMPQHHTCFGHMTFYYKRVPDIMVGGSCLLFIHLSGLTLSPETRVWLVPNACRS